MHGLILDSCIQFRGTRPCCRRSQPARSSRRHAPPGALVVIELKASENIQLAALAVDYWLRVQSHQRAVEFQPNGYFADLEINPEPPLVWLVTPGAFIPPQRRCRKYLDAEIPIARTDLDENWRHGVKVLFRQ
jgi:hypothetical protein